MGWLSYFLVNDIAQDKHSSDLTDEIVRLQDELEKQRNSSPMPSSLPIKELQKENDELKLYIAALVKILISKGVMTPDEIKQMIAVVDSQDGSQDGKFTGNINP